MGPGNAAPDGRDDAPGTGIGVGRGGDLVLPVNLLQKNEIFFEELADHGQRLTARIDKRVGHAVQTIH